MTDKVFGFFIANLWGVFQKPHATYLRLSRNKGYNTQIIFIWFLVLATLFFSRAVDAGIFSKPLFFVISLGKLYFFAIITFLLSVYLIYLLGVLFGLPGNIKTIIILWGFTYIPTIVWFSGMAIIFYLFSQFGQGVWPHINLQYKNILSILLAAFSIALFYWKLILYYLTLRVGFRTGWRKIIAISLIFFPSAAGYSYLMYRLGIFKVPFL